MSADARPRLFHVEQFAYITISEPSSAPSQRSSEIFMPIRKTQAFLRLSALSLLAILLASTLVPR